MNHSARRTRGRGGVGAEKQGGSVLILVMLVLLVASALGIGAAQVSMMGERGSRNDRDLQVAWQAAEAALMDAEFDIRGPNGSSRRSVFGANGNQPNRAKFPSNGCGTSGEMKGLCEILDESQAVNGVKQKWLTVDFSAVGNAAQTVAFGSFTGQVYPSGGVGVQSTKDPRYMIELIRDYAQTRDKSEVVDVQYLYRVTSMGYGPRDDIQAVAQMLLRP